MNEESNDTTDDNQWFIRGQSHGIFHRAMSASTRDKLDYIRGYLSAVNQTGGLHVIHGRNGAIAIRVSRTIGVAKNKARSADANGNRADGDPTPQAE